MPLGRLGANTHILYTKDGGEAVVFDCGGDEDRLIEFLGAHDLALKAIILTHGHSDHICGVNGLKAATGAPIIAHEAEKDMLLNPDYNLSSGIGTMPTTIDVDTYVKDGDVMELICETFTFIHTPGHTFGGMCIMVGDELFTGDTLFKGSIGRTDLYGGNIQTMRKTLERIKTLPHRLRVHCGHGPSTRLRDEVNTNPYLR